MIQALLAGIEYRAKPAGELRRNIPCSCHGTSTAGSSFPQHVIAHVALVRRDDREMIFTASREKIYRPADIGGNLRPAYRNERHHQLDRNTGSAELRGHVNRGAAAERVTDDHDRAQPAAVVLLDGLLRERRPVAIISDRGRNAAPSDPAAEFAEPRRIIAQTEQNIKGRDSPCLRDRKSVV